MQRVVVDRTLDGARHVIRTEGNPQSGLAYFEDNELDEAIAWAEGYNAAAENFERALNEKLDRMLGTVEEMKGEVNA